MAIRVELPGPLESDLSSSTTAGVSQNELNEAFRVWRELGREMTPEDKAEELAETARSAGTE